jgi:hypothetical protein
MTKITIKSLHHPQSKTRLQWTPLVKNLTKNLNWLVKKMLTMVMTNEIDCKNDPLVLVKSHKLAFLKLWLIFYFMLS